MEGAFINSKIVLLGTQIAIGGAQRLLLGQGRWFYDKGNEVIAIFIYAKSDLLEDWREQYPFKIINLDAWSSTGWNFKNFLKLIRGIFNLFFILLTEKPSMIETFTTESNIVGIPIAWLARVPVKVATHHGIVKNYNWRLSLLHRIAINLFAENLVLVSDHLRRTSINNDKIKPDKLTVINNGIERPVWNKGPIEIRNEVRTDLGIGPDDKIVISVGRLSIQKSIDTLLLAAPKIIGAEARTKFVIVGDGGESENLVHLSQSLKVEEHVLFLGERQDAYNLMRAADVYVMTSITEGFPLSLLEAMIVGLPVVTTDFEGVRDIIEPGENGLIAEIKNPSEVAEKIIRLLENVELRKTFSEANMEKDFSFDEMCLQYQKLFEQLSSRK